MKHQFSRIYFNKRILFTCCYNIFLCLVFTVGGVRWRPTEQPSNCQHLGYWCQWQHAYVCRGLLQRRSLHRHAARGDGAAGNQSSKRVPDFSPSLSALKFIPRLSVPVTESPLARFHIHSKYLQQLSASCWQANALEQFQSSLICRRDRQVRMFHSIFRAQGTFQQANQPLS